MFSLAPLPAAYGESLAARSSSVEPPVQFDSGWWMSRGVLHEQVPLHAATVTLILWLVLFGHRIFL